MSLGIGNNLFQVLSSGGTTNNLNTTAAKALVVFGGIANALAPFTISDSEGNDYSFNSTVTGASYSLYVAIVLSPNTNANHNWTVSASSFSAVVITNTDPVAFDTLDDSPFFDTTFTIGPDAISSGAITLSCIASNRSNIFGDYSDPSGYTKLGVANTDTSFAAAIQVDYNLSPSNPESITWVGNGFQGAANLVSIKPSGTPTVTSVVRLLASLGVGQ